MPEEWYVYQVCQLYRTTPVDGGAAVQPVRTTRRILQLLSYQRAHDIVTGAVTLKDDDLEGDANARLLVAEVKAARVAAEDAAGQPLIGVPS